MGHSDTKSIQGLLHVLLSPAHVAPPTSTTYVCCSTVMVPHGTGEMADNGERGDDHIGTPANCFTQLKPVPSSVEHWPAAQTLRPCQDSKIVDPCNMQHKGCRAAALSVDCIEREFNGILNMLLSHTHVATDPARDDCRDLHTRRFIVQDSVCKVTDLLEKVRATTWSYAALKTCWLLCSRQPMRYSARSAITVVLPDPGPAAFAYNPLV